MKGIRVLDGGWDMLPVFGEEHPLRRGARRFLIQAAATAGAVHITIFAGWFYARSLDRPIELPERTVTIVQTDFIPYPPSIKKTTEPTSPVTVPIPDRPPIGIPEPVPDHAALCQSLAPNDWIDREFHPDVGDLARGPTDSLVFHIPEPQTGGAEPIFEAAEEMPELVRLPSPVYPEMARQAEVEGTVIVLVVVGKDGKVQQAHVEQGVPMLDAPALEAARQAVFRPALQQHKPVSVWVRIPMTFRLR